MIKLEILKKLKVYNKIRLYKLTVIKARVKVKRYLKKFKVLAKLVIIATILTIILSKISKNSGKMKVFTTNLSSVKTLSNLIERIYSPISIENLSFVNCLNLQIKTSILILCILHC